jgi:hypothetical protein
LATDTLAKLITETLIGLGTPPKEFCEVEEAARAVIHSIALLKQHSTLSAQNLNLIPYEWEPSARSEMLVGVPDLAIPAWVERKWSTNTNPSQDYWVDVRVCNLAELESSRLRGEWGRCTFHVNQGQLWITFSYAPTDYSFRTHRLWYSPDVQLAQAFNDSTAGLDLSPNFFPLISAMAEMELLSTMRIRAASSKNSSKELVSAWDKREIYLGGKITEWTDRFKHFAQGERGNRKGGRRRTILPKGMRI